jgi:hypothetical protein
MSKLDHEWPAIEDAHQVWNPDLKRQVLRSSRLSKGATLAMARMRRAEGGHLLKIVSQSPISNR